MILFTFRTCSSQLAKGKRHATGGNSVQPVQVIEIPNIEQYVEVGIYHLCRSVCHAPKSRLGRNGHTAQVHQLFMGKFEQESWVMIRSGTHPPNQESRRKRPGIYSDK